jgi:ATP-dependent protease ClpP protease subunit
MNGQNPPQQPTPHQPAPPIIKPVSLVFVGPIMNPAAKNLRATCCSTVTSGTKEIQILFSSSGGQVDEGFALYNFLRALPVKLTMHAIGKVDTIGLAVFLAGERRLCSPDTMFLFHEIASASAGAVNHPRSQWAAIVGSRDTLRLKELLKSRTAFKDEDFNKLELYHRPMIQDAAFAKEKGIVHEVKGAAISAGNLIADIDL